MEDVDLPREEFLEKAEQFFTGIPVGIIDDIVITKRYNPEDIEYWMDIEDAVFQIVSMFFESKGNPDFWVNQIKSIQL